MRILQRLASHLARRHKGGRISLAQVAETLAEIRLLLEREVDFRREQLTILQALRVYRSVPGVRIPRLILPLSTATITALTEEKGVLHHYRSTSTTVLLKMSLGSRLLPVPFPNPSHFQC
jgi:predicted unusual protein kinase regulating ubiquinone biosynthesis (AarF/ABC1/UbiB family)